MKRAVLGCLLVAGLVMAAVAVGEQRGEVSVPRAAAAPAAVAGTELVVVPSAVGDKGQVLTVIDQRQRVLSVYHIDLVTGKIALKSVRNIQWDLQMTYLNNENPLPQEIRSLLEPR
jgi:hypothetical protein